MPPSLETLLARQAPIEELALEVARDAYPRLRAGDVLDALDELARPLRARALGDRPLREQAMILAHHLHDELEFRGDELDYHDPRNGYLNEVLERRMGLPISLSILWMAIGRRADVHIDGVGFPGHFLVRVGPGGGDEAPVVVDPFHGGIVVGHAQLERLAIHHLGGAEKLRPEHLTPIDARTMLVRVLVNLKHAHERRGDRASALVVCDRLVDLTDSPTFRRDRGLHALALGSRAAALDDFDAYLDAGAPEGDSEAIHRVRDALTHRHDARPS